MSKLPQEQRNTKLKWRIRQTIWLHHMLAHILDQLLACMQARTPSTHFLRVYSVLPAVGSSKGREGARRASFWAWHGDQHQPWQRAEEYIWNRLFDLAALEVIATIYFKTITHNPSFTWVKYKEFGWSLTSVHQSLLWFVLPSTSAHALFKVLINWLSKHSAVRGLWVAAQWLWRQFDLHHLVLLHLFLHAASSWKISPQNWTFLFLVLNTSQIAFGTPM